MYRAVVLLIVVMLTACSATGPATLADDGGGARSDTLILFGGIGYIDEAGHPALYGLLTDESFRLEDATETMVRGLNQAGGLPRLSKYPVALYLEDAERAVADTLGRTDPPALATDDLPSYFRRTLGLFFVGAYEDQIPVGFRYRTAAGGERRSYDDYFVTSVSALLVDLETDEVLLSASALGVERRRSNSAPVTTTDDVAGAFLTAYTNAASLALERLTRIAESAAGPFDSERPHHLVTGVWVDEGPARDLFTWQSPGAPQDLCRVPTGCRDEHECRSFEGLLAHGMTDMMSEAGMLTMPPLSRSEWRQDNAWEVAARFAIPQNRRSLTDRLRRIAIDPKQATYKYVVALRGTDMRTEQLDGVVTADHYVASIYLIRGTSERGRCDSPGGLDLLGEDVFGSYESRRPRSRPAAEGGLQRSLYTMAILQALLEFDTELRP